MPVVKTLGRVRGVVAGSLNVLSSDRPNSDLIMSEDTFKVSVLFKKGFSPCVNASLLSIVNGFPKELRNSVDLSWVGSEGFTNFLK